MNTPVFSAAGRRTGEPPISWLMKLPLERPSLISLAAGFTDNRALPVAAARELLDRLLRSRGAARPALQYGTTVGDPGLRRLTAARVGQLDGGLGAATGPGAAERTLITHGSQQLLYLVTEALCDPDDIVLVEDPTYFVFLSILQSHGVRCRGVAMEPDGLCPSSLAATLEDLHRQGLLARVKLLYLVSYYQNPTGTTTALARKAAALRILRRHERAAGHPIYLLEDAAYREMRFAGPDTPSALTLSGAADRVVYAGTYSKPFATGARVGFGILPPRLHAVVARLKGNHDFGTSNLLQQLLRTALASGRYERHLAQVRRRYAAKARVMARALARHLTPDIQWRQPEGGMYFWLRLPNGVATGMRSRVFRAALRREVLYVPGQLCYAEDPTRTRPDHEMRLSFASASPGDLRRGIERLARALPFPPARRSAPGQAP